eukprot:TRINITY_DN29561_c0_g1_i2.p1 TRINITY_DN29561_c0_g1~~TRINITY_DN29561_c0_g1_i2.p1  ORF type:complete len:515 (-),score=102.68 TRINITY_DN29561_c0_g1_i2:72-1589(-)
MSTMTPGLQGSLAEAAERTMLLEQGLEQDQAVLQSKKVQVDLTLRRRIVLLSTLLLATAFAAFSHAWQSRENSVDGSGEGLGALLGESMYPQTEDEVLTFDKWAEIYHVQDVNSSLAKRKYFAYAHHPVYIREQAAAEQVLRWQIAHDCPKQEIGVDMSTREGFDAIPAVLSADACQKICTETADCAGFVWGAQPDTPGLSQACFRKRLSQGEQLLRSSNAGVISGLPCKRQAQPYWWPWQDWQLYDLPAPEMVGIEPRAGSATMLCIVLFRAYGSFQCDGQTLYSSQAVELAPGVASRRIHSTLLCELGGQFVTALNLGIFMALWRQVILDGDFLSYDWTIKADPDTVFFPARLRPILVSYSSALEEDGVYLNNCRYGLHGPMETFSQNALRALAARAQVCSNAMDGEVCNTPESCQEVWQPSFREHCNGNCTAWWGEDIWVDQCLKRFTKAQRVFVPELLQEDHCDPKPGWRSCKDQDTVAFHPFKTIEEFQACWSSGTSTSS